MTDAALLERARGGDRDAAGAFVARHLDAVHRYARAVCRDASSADDATQDVFLAALRPGPPLAGADARPWLLVATRHASFHHARRRAGEPTHFEPLDALGELAGWGDPEAEYAAREANTQLEAALARLSTEDREVLVLRDLEGLEGEAAAEALGLSLAGMKSRLHRARLRLMAELRKGGDDGHGG